MRLDHLLSRETRRDDPLVKDALPPTPILDWRLGVLDGSRFRVPPSKIGHRLSKIVPTVYCGLCHSSGVKALAILDVGVAILDEGQGER